MVNAIKAREAEIEAAAARRAVLTPTRSATRRLSPQKTTFAGGRAAVVTLPLVRSRRLTSGYPPISGSLLATLLQQSGSLIGGAETLMDNLGQNVQRVKSGSFGDAVRRNQTVHGRQ